MILAVSMAAEHKPYPHGRVKGDLTTVEGPSCCRARVRHWTKKPMYQFSEKLAGRIAEAGYTPTVIG